TRALHLEIAAQNIRDRDLFRLRKRCETRRDLVTLIDRKPMQTFEIPSRLVVTVLEPDPESLFPLDQIKRLSPRPNLSWLPRFIRDKLDRRRNRLSIRLCLGPVRHLQQRLALFE